VFTVRHALAVPHQAVRRCWLNTGHPGIQILRIVRDPFFGRPRWGHLRRHTCPSP